MNEELAKVIIRKILGLQEFKYKEQFKLVLENAYNMIRDDETVPTEIVDAYQEAVSMVGNLSFEEIKNI